MVEVSRLKKEASVRNELMPSKLGPSELRNMELEE